MTIIKSSSKMEAIKAFINTWLKDPRVYCNTCDMTYVKGMPPCCEDPQIGTNKDMVLAVGVQNKKIADNLYSETGESRGKSMRYAVSMPPQLFNDLEGYFFNTYKEQLFNNKKELRQFMKEFPACTARRI